MSGERPYKVDPHLLRRMRKPASMEKFSSVERPATNELSEIYNSWFGDEDGVHAQMGLLPQPERLDRALDVAIGRWIANDDSVQFRLIASKWEDIAGKALARNARPCQLSGKRLVVEVAHPAWQAEVRALSKMILTKIEAVAPGVCTGLSVKAGADSRQFERSYKKSN